MKRTIPIVAATLPVLAIAFYMLRGHPTPSSFTNTMPAAAKPAPKSGLPVQQHQAQLSPEERQKRREAFERSEAKAMAAADTLAKLNTPEIRAEQVDTHLKRVRPRYQELFDQWKLNPSDVDEVMAILRERDLHTLDRFLEQGRSSVTDKEANKKLDTNEVIDEGIDELQLTKILGKAHFAQFTQLEATMKAELHSRATARFGDGG